MNKTLALTLTLAALNAPGCFYQVRGEANGAMYGNSTMPTAVAVSQPPPPVNTQLANARPPKPSDSAVWVDGYQDWQGSGWVQVQGHWENPQPNTVWQQPVYVNGQYHPGYWRPSNQQPVGPYATPVGGVSGSSGGTTVVQTGNGQPGYYGGVNNGGVAQPVAQPGVQGGVQGGYVGGGYVGGGSTGGVAQPVAQPGVSVGSTGGGYVNGNPGGGYVGTQTGGSVGVAQPVAQPGVSVGGVNTGYAQPRPTTGTAVTVGAPVGTISGTAAGVRPTVATQVSGTAVAAQPNTGVRITTVGPNAGSPVVVAGTTAPPATMGATQVSATAGTRPVMGTTVATGTVTTAGRPGVTAAGSTTGTVVSPAGGITNMHVPLRPAGCYPNCPPQINRPDPR
ncbi:MAG: hypothetical protein Q8Q09_17345 [Deltaproteobacteria bacterium]|nr:hypothetical protein [Deltaproteobacteria bacterium]